MKLISLNPNYVRKEKIDRKNLPEIFNIHIRFNK